MIGCEANGPGEAKEADIVPLTSAPRGTITLRKVQPVGNTPRRKGTER